MYTPKTPPFSHQRRALEASRGRSGFAFFMEMGTGKTKVLIDEAGEMCADGGITGLLVIAPKGVCRTWVRELETHLGVAHTADIWQSSPNRELRTRLSSALSRQSSLDKLRVVVVNVESFGSGLKSREYVRSFLGAHSAMMVIDESQTIKNPAANRTKTIMQLGPLARFRRVATGTPAPNSPMDMYSQLEFLQPGVTRQRSFYGFRSRYAVLQDKEFGGRKFKVEVGYRNLDELQGITASISFRVQKSECLDLPPKVYAQREVELTSEQQRAYRQMVEEALTTINGRFTSSQSAITTLIRLQQIVCGYIRDDDGYVSMLDSRRVQAVLDIAEQTQGDMIVWVGQHTPMIPVLRAALEEKFGLGCTAQFSGGNVSSRDVDAARFVQDPSCRFMVATQAAGGRGNTWTNASSVVYFANTYNLEERVQSEDRCHRAGQTMSVLYTDLTAADVQIDQRLVRALVRKEEISSTLMGEAAREWL